MLLKVAEMAGLIGVAAFDDRLNKVLDADDASLAVMNFERPTAQVHIQEIAAGVRAPQASATPPKKAWFLPELIAALTCQQRLPGPLIATVASGNADGRLSAAGDHTMSRLLDDLEEIFVEESPLRGYRDNPHIAPRLIMAMALGITAQKQWLFATGRVPTDDELKRSVNAYWRPAVRGQPASPVIGGYNGKVIEIAHLNNCSVVGFGRRQFLLMPKCAGMARCYRRLR